METATPGSLLARGVGQRKCFAAQGAKTPAPGPAIKGLYIFIVEFQFSRYNV